MKTSRLSASQLKKITHLIQSAPFNITQAAKKIGIARNTLKRQLTLLQAPVAEKTNFQLSFSQIIAEASPYQTIKQLWQCYIKHTPNGLRYSQFAHQYAE